MLLRSSVLGVAFLVLAAVTTPLELRRKHDVRVMLEGIVRRLRAAAAVWDYNLWNEKLDWFGRPDGKGIDNFITLLEE